MFALSSPRSRLLDLGADHESNGADGDSLQLAGDSWGDEAWACPSLRSELIGSDVDHPSKESGWRSAARHAASQRFPAACLRADGSGLSALGPVDGPARTHTP